MSSASVRLPMPASVNSSSTLSGVDRETRLKKTHNVVKPESRFESRDRVTVALAPRADSADRNR